MKNRVSRLKRLAVFMLCGVTFLGSSNVASYAKEAAPLISGRLDLLSAMDVEESQTEARITDAENLEKSLQNAVTFNDDGAAITDDDSSVSSFSLNDEAKPIGVGSKTVSLDTLFSNGVVRFTGDSTNSPYKKVNPGETVNISVVPDKDYELSSVEVSYRTDGKTRADKLAEIKNKGENLYIASSQYTEGETLLDDSEITYGTSSISFVMPEYDTFVSVMFTKRVCGDEALEVESKEDSAGNKVEPTSVLDEIRMNVDDEYATNSNKMEALTTLRVTSTFAYRDKLPDNPTIDDLWAREEGINEDDTTNYKYEDAFAYNMESTIYMYNIDNDSDYLVGKINADSLDVSDVIFAYNTTSGDVVTDCIFDKETSLVYIPKIYLELDTSDWNTDTGFSPLSCQLLYLIDEPNYDDILSEDDLPDDTEADLSSVLDEIQDEASEENEHVPVDFIISHDGLDGNFVEPGVVNCDLYSDQIIVHVADDDVAKKNALDADCTVRINGVEADLTDDTYVSFDYESGDLHLIGFSPVGVDSIEIVFSKVSTVESVLESIVTGGAPKKAKALTKLKITQLKKTTAFGSLNLDGMFTGSYDTYAADSADYGKSKAMSLKRLVGYGTFKSDSYQDFGTVSHSMGDGDFSAYTNEGSASEKYEPSKGLYGDGVHGGSSMYVCDAKLALPDWDDPNSPNRHVVDVSNPKKMMKKRLNRVLDLAKVRIFRAAIGSVMAQTRGYGSSHTTNYHEVKDNSDDMAKSYYGRIYALQWNAGSEKKTTYDTDNVYSPCIASNGNTDASWEMLHTYQFRGIRQNINIKGANTNDRSSFSKEYDEQGYRAADRITGDGTKLAFTRMHSEGGEASFKFRLAVRSSTKTTKNKPCDLTGGWFFKNSYTNNSNRFKTSGVSYRVPWSFPDWTNRKVRKGKSGKIWASLSKNIMLTCSHANNPADSFIPDKGNYGTPKFRFSRWRVLRVEFDKQDDPKLTFKKTISDQGYLTDVKMAATSRIKGNFVISVVGAQGSQTQTAAGIIKVPFYANYTSNNSAVSAGPEDEDIWETELTLTKAAQDTINVSSSGVKSSLNDGGLYTLEQIATMAVNDKITTYVTSDLPNLTYRPIIGATFEVTRNDTHESILVKSTTTASTGSDEVSEMPEVPLDSITITMQDVDSQYQHSGTIDLTDYLPKSIQQIRLPAGSDRPDDIPITIKEIQAAPGYQIPPSLKVGIPEKLTYHLVKGSTDNDGTLESQVGEEEETSGQDEDADPVKQKMESMCLGTAPVEIGTDGDFDPSTQQGSSYQNRQVEDLDLYNPVSVSTFKLFKSEEVHVDNTGDPEIDWKILHIDEAQGSLDNTQFLVAVYPIADLTTAQSFSTDHNLDTSEWTVANGHKFDIKGYIDSVSALLRQTSTGDGPGAGDPGDGDDQDQSDNDEDDFSPGDEEEGGNDGAIDVRVVNSAYEGASIQRAIAACRIRVMPETVRDGTYRQVAAYDTEHYVANSGDMLGQLRTDIGNNQFYYRSGIPMGYTFKVWECKPAADYSIDGHGLVCDIVQPDHRAIDDYTMLMEDGSVVNPNDPINPFAGALNLPSTATTISEGAATSIWYGSANEVNRIGVKIEKTDEDRWNHPQPGSSETHHYTAGENTPQGDGVYRDESKSQHKYAYYNIFNNTHKTIYADIDGDGICETTVPDQQYVLPPDKVLKIDVTGKASSDDNATNAAGTNSNLLPRINGFELHEIDPSYNYKINEIPINMDVFNENHIEETPIPGVFHDDGTQAYDTYWCADRQHNDPCTEPIYRGGVKFQKWDAELGIEPNLSDPSVNNQPKPQGDASLAGAKFEVTNDSDEDVFVNGRWYKPGEVCYTMTTNSTGLAETSSTFFPAGKYTIREVEASTGYHIDADWHGTFIVSEEDGFHDNVQEIAPYHMDPDSRRILEPVMRYAVTTTKGDLLLEQSGATNPSQALNGEDHCAPKDYGANLLDVDIEIRNISDNPVVYYPTSSDVARLVPTAADKSKPFADDSNICEVIPTKYDVNQHKYVSETLPNALPYGTYIVRELPKGKDADGNLRANESYLYLDGRRVKADEVGLKITVHGGRDNFDKTIEYFEAGKPFDLAKFRADYAAQEKTGLKRDDFTWTTKDDNGVDLAFFNIPIRSDFYFNKVIDGTEDRLHTAFVIESYPRTPAEAAGNVGGVTSGSPDDKSNREPLERHLIITDENGDYSSNDVQHGSSYPHWKHSHNTNANDVWLDAVDAGETLVMSELTQDVGLFFFKGEDGESLSSAKCAAGDYDNLGALPYGKYKVQEVRTDTNVGLKLQNFDIIVNRYGIHFDSNGAYINGDKTFHIDGGTVRDPMITLSSELVDTKSGTHEACASYNMTLKDTVTYKNLDEKTPHLVEARLYDITANKFVTLTDTNKPAESTGNSDFDDSDDDMGQSVGGGTVVDDGSDPDTIVVGDDSLSSNQVADGANSTSKGDGSGTDDPVDPTDEDYTGGTSGGNGTTPGGSTGGGGSSVITDPTVNPSNSTTIDPSVDTTQYLIDGDMIRMTFKTTNTGEGKFNVTYTFDGREVEGHKLVSFVSIYTANGKQLIASHEDPTDEDQTVTVPACRTSAFAVSYDDSFVLGAGGTAVIGDENSVANQNIVKSKIAPAVKGMVIEDTVTYTNLIPGNTYTVKGTMMTPDEEYNPQPVVVNGVVVTSETEFTPTEPDGTVVVRFNFDASSLTGKKLVVFEQISSRNNVIAKHEDINDEEQTVYMPDIKTKARDSKTSLNEGYAGDGTVTIYDTVEYAHLQPGLEYVMTGTLMDKSDPTGKTAITDASGKPVTSSVTFTPSEQDGTVEMAFTFDATKWLGKSAVVFETLYYRNTQYASHEDITDEDQTVNFPEIRTLAVNKEADVHLINADKSAKFVDHVSYKNVQVGKKYTMVGVLMDKTTGTPVLINGNQITASKEFTPTTSEGIFDFDFDIDASALAGRSIVVYEQLLRDDKTVSKHEDINDEDQTIYVPRIKTLATDFESKKFVDPMKEAVITDKVTYNNLVTDCSYVLKGSLVDKASGKVITTASAPFTTKETMANLNAVANAVASGTSVSATTSATATPTKAPSEPVQITLGDVNKEGQVVTGQAVAQKAYGTTAVGGSAPLVGLGAKSVACVDGIASMEFKFDATAYRGKDIVVFEEVYAVVNGKEILIASEKTLQNGDQTVHVNNPTINTVAHKKGSMVHALQSSGSGSIVDDITLKELTAGGTYRITSKLMDKATGEMITIPGKEQGVTKEVEVPIANPVLEATYDISDLSAFAGKRLVAFNVIERKVGSTYQRVISEEDMNNADQTVYFPSIRTTAVDSVTKNKTALFSAGAVVKDTVEYTNLEPGVMYMMEGYMVDKETGKSVSKTISLPFIPEKADGSVDVTIPVDTTKLGGKTLVAYESLKLNNEVICEHKDLNDKAQTIYVAEIDTSLTNSSGSKVIGASSNTKLIDEVSYENLVPGKTYKLYGKIVNKNSGYDSVNVGSAAKAKTNTLDASGLSASGSAATATSTATPAATPTATPAISVLNQALSSPSATPGLATGPAATVSNTLSSDAVPNGQISYTTYKATEVKGTSKNDRGGLGTAIATFTAKKASGTAKVKYNIDTSSIAGGVKLVAFETLTTEDDKIVAVHMDIDDKDQTVTMRSHSTVATGVESYGPLMAMLSLLSLVVTSIVIWFRRRKLKMAVDKAKKQ